MIPGTLAKVLMTQMELREKSDIARDLWILHEYAGRVGVENVVEFGVRSGVSTIAILAAQPRKLTSYDIEDCPSIDTLNIAKGKTEFKFVRGNTLEIDPVEEVDLLFIDTLHTYDQLSKELERHGNGVKHFIILHDTVSFGAEGEDGSKPGLIQAYQDFLKANPAWRLDLISTAQNGLTVLRRGRIFDADDRAPLPE